MNKNNVWSLADLGDEAGLRRAIVNVPSCINVCGWSYAGGRRRGVSHDPETGSWEITEMNGAPAPILHFATIRRSLPCVLLALENGASADSVVHGATADAIAKQLGPKWNDIQEIVEIARKRQHNPLGALEESETTDRRILEARQQSAFQHLQDSFAAGIVDVTVLFRENGATTRYVLSLPRYISFKTLLTHIETKIGQRVLVAFRTPLDYHHASADASVNASLHARLTDEDELQWLAEKEARDRPQFLELKSRTTMLFLSQERPECIARPMAMNYRPMALRSVSPALLSPATSPANHRGNTKARAETPQPGEPQSDLARKIIDIQAQVAGLPSDKRHERLLKLLTEEEVKNGVTAMTKEKVISKEQLEKALARLYDYSVQEIRRRRDSIKAFEDHAQEAFAGGRRSKGRSLSPKAEETVSRLFAGVEVRAASISRLEERVWAARPKPATVSLPEEEISAATQRLFDTAVKKKSESLKQATQKIYAESDAPVLSDLQKHVDSVYTTAVAKKKAAIDKIEQRYGDFRRLKKAGKKLSPQETAAVADRLSKHH